MYIVKCELLMNDPFDQFMEGEYSGIVHKDKEAAEREMEEAFKCKNVMYAWVEER